MAITFSRVTAATGDGNTGGMSASIALPNVTASDSTFTVPSYSGTITNWVQNAATYPQTTYQTDSYFRGYLYINGTRVGSSYSFAFERSAALTLSEASGWTSKAWTGTTPALTLNTADYFTSANNTTRTVTMTLYRAAWGYTCPDIFSGPSGTGSAAGTGTATLTLNVPPTFTASAISYDKNYVYAGLTTASVTVSNSAAYYGGTISDITLTIGSQTASRSTDGTLSIALDSAGTFTPTITVTDSRGQTATQTLSAITVNTYTAPTLTFDADRTDSTGVPNDEGTYITADCTFTFADAIATLAAPSIVLTDETGTQTTPTVTWYSARSSAGTLSGSVTWANVTSGQTIYALIPNVNTQYSYQVSIRPRDDKGTGTAIVQTVGAAFYTVDFLAGGHGIAFGQPASQVGFFCNMDAHFVDANSVMRALFDFVYPVGSYYETSDTAFNPNVTWGGTWSLETEGQVHVSAGTNYQISGALSNTTDGGEAEHTLTVDEMPSHNHLVNYVNYNRGSGNNATMGYLSSSSQANNAYSENEGNDAPHNNMQPYIIVNRWHRTA